MNLDRNINGDGLGKYAVINLRKLQDVAGDPSTFERWTPEVQQALQTLVDVGALEWGCVGQADEFFLIKLKDFYAQAALIAYANAIEPDDAEFGAEVHELARRAGPRSPHCKRPD